MIFGTKKEIIVKDFLIIIEKILRIWNGVINCGLKLARYAGGYGYSLSTHFEGNSTKKKIRKWSNADICGVPVKTHIIIS